jgi:pSer/pThr/pTyr-binding forkhead associated (FHA) protein
MRGHQVFPAGSEVAAVGRDQPDRIESPKDSISQSHARIVNRESRFWVWDTNNTNETFVNGRRSEEHVLRNADRIGIGDKVPVFHRKWEDRR